MAEGDSRGGLRLLEWVPSQKLLVKTARFAWSTIWRIMISELAPQSPEGDYVRPAPQVGSAASWPAELPAVGGRYHVYLGNACPWCHRVGLTLALRGLLGGVSVTRMDDDPERASRGGWCFSADAPDPLCGANDLREVYDRCTPGGAYTGRCTAPLLVDLRTGEIISNESGDIVRMLNQLDLDLPEAEGGGEERAVDLYPAELRAAVDATNAWVYEAVNNGVYRCGFATTQAAYERAEGDVHEGLARCEALLGASRFLCGDVVTEADVRLLPTICRFDGVYASFFRCGRRQIRSDYPQVWSCPTPQTHAHPKLQTGSRSIPGPISPVPRLTDAQLRRWLGTMLELSGPGLFDLDDARRSYYANLFPLNPGGIVPAGPTPADLGMPDAAVFDEGAFSWREREAVVA